MPRDMDGGNNADSDHSLSWEDFYGSTTDLTPTLLGILNTFLEPASPTSPESVQITPPSKMDAPKQQQSPIKREEVKRKMTDPPTQITPTKDPRLMAGSVKLPGLSTESPTTTPEKQPQCTSTPKKSSPPSKMSYVSRLKSFGLRKSANAEDTPSVVKPPASEVITKLNSEVIAKVESNRRNLLGSFENLSPNVRKIISSVGDQGELVAPKKSNLGTVGRFSYRGKHSIIPLTGATSKIMENGTEIYDKPAKVTSSIPRKFVSPTQSNLLNRVAQDWSTPSPPRVLSTFEPPKPAIYDTPVSRPPSIYDVPKVVTPTVVVTEGNGGGVTRPLSMSSIASSTSSSSGSSRAPNKGGANSAYLASIESLDDHSDVDHVPVSRMPVVAGTTTTTSPTERPMTNADSTDGGGVTEGPPSAAESATTLAARPRYCDPNLSLLQRVCVEIVDTENVYVDDLRQVIEGYLHYWREENAFSDEQLNDLFSNVEEIYAFNRTFSQRLNECNLEAVAIAKCFVQHSAGFGVYTQYCTNYPGIMAALARLMREAKSAQPFRTRQAALGHPLPLGSYLLKPVQRILKYHLLLQNLVKQHKSQDTEYALHKMTDIAHDINDMKRRHEHSVRVQEIQSLLYGWNGQDLTTFGELCAEGTFRVFGAKAMRHAFLFDKMLLLTKNKEYGMLAYKSHILCNNLMLVESIQGQPLSFHVIPFDCPRMQVTLQAKSLQQKREWTLLIKRNILENYNAVIPSHARQLVMELGQNKTDDDMLAEKSSTLMSHASMRKQLSAPEYLEKRKLERDRRKSFESGIRYKLKRSNMRKGPNNSDLQENEESEREQTAKEDNEDIGDSNYICYDCERTRKPCEECDCSKEEVIYSNTNGCTKCEAFKSRSLNKSDINLCSDCCNKSVSEQRNVKSKFLSDENLTVDTFCDNCNKSKVLSTKVMLEKSKILYDKLNTGPETNLIDVKRTCLKCQEIRENVITEKNNHNNLTSTSPCCIHTVNKLTYIDDCDHSITSNLQRRKSDSNLQSMESLNSNVDNVTESESIYSLYGKQCSVCGKHEIKCRRCGNSTLIRTHNCIKSEDNQAKNMDTIKGLEIKMYTAKTVPKKISKLKKNRAKNMRHLTVDPTAKFYTDFSNDVLHISESTDSINTNQTEIDSIKNKSSDNIDIPTDMDEETYKSLIQKTDSFKKSEMEKDKLVSQIKKESVEEKVIPDSGAEDEVFESNDDSQTEKPLEQIISQLLMQNREFQKILKRHQMRNTNNRRHQRLLKSHSNPEKTFAQNRENILKNKPQYARHISAEETTSNDLGNVVSENIAPEVTKTKDEHIYETLLPVKEKTPYQNDNDSKKPIVNDCRNSITESDYVYLCFDDKNNVDAYKVPVHINSFEEDNEYAVPKIIPSKVNVDVTMRSEKETSDENLSEVWKRISKDTIIENMRCEGKMEQKSNDTLSPNLPQIWLSRQKEHFGIPKEKKSGSLPRSFQVILNTDEPKVTNPPNKSNKVYLNKEGKVVQTDRPFTIASDQGEMSYDDIERFMNLRNDSGLTFPQKHNLDQSSCSLLAGESIDEIFTRSTLELQAEIDKCYNNRFGSAQITNKTLSPNIDSISSSLEVINDHLECETSQEDINALSVHPEHKIYKTSTSNILSFKSVLNRFKSKNRASSEQLNSDESNNTKVPIEKKTSPKSNGRSLFQKLKISNDDESKDNPTTSTAESNKRSENSTSLYVDSVPISLDTTDNSVSKSCNNISSIVEVSKFQVSHSVTSTNLLIANKSTRSHQDIHKLPTYKQGSRLLGARIAQSDYADPKALISNSNVLINKTVIRPESVLSNSSNFTSSSEGYFTSNANDNKQQNSSPEVAKPNMQFRSDESFYEKSFEEIEKMFHGEDIFRDSAIYSDDGNSYSADFDLKPKTIFEPIKAPVKQISNKPSKNIEIVKAAPPIPAKPVFDKNMMPNMKQRVLNESINTVVTSKSTLCYTTKVDENKNGILSKKLSNLTLKEVEENCSQNTSVTKSKIVLPNYQRSTSTGVSMKRMSFERCSLDSTALTRRSKSVSIEENSNVSITKSVQERKKEIEMMTECNGNVDYRKSVDGLESLTSINRSFSFRTGSKPSSPSNGSQVPVFKSKCNIPVRNCSNEIKEVKTPDSVNDDTTGVSWVKQVVNRFQ